MGVLAIYDITGIQNFIFTSTKLIEIIGGSHLVKDILEKALPDVMKKELGGDSCKTEWKPDDNGVAPEFELPGNEKLKAEVLYIGGGNAWVAFREQADYVAVNQALSIRILEQTYLLRLASVGVRTDFGGSYRDDTTAAQKELARQKAGIIGSAPGGGLSVTKQSASDGFPVVDIDRKNKTQLSTVQVLKRQKYVDIGEDANRDFASYTLKGEDSFLAVVHIDGNNIGAMIENYMGEKNSYQEAIPAMRAMSFALSGYYSGVLKELKKNLDEAVNDKKIWPEITGDIDRKRLFAIRPIVQEGDDITFVCNGSIALSVTAYILRRLAETELTIPATKDSAAVGKKVSACAGICMFHSHFPFSRAYAMAEECCSNAKQAGKNSNLPGDAKTHGNWIDFFVNGSSVPESVETIREQIWFGELTADEICGRPYCIVPEEGASDNRSFSRLQTLLTNWIASPDSDTKNGNVWPRGKCKSLRDALSGLGDPEEILDHMKSQGKVLPGMNNGLQADPDAVIHAGMFSVYYDALEMMDLYQSVLDCVKKGDTTHE